MIEDGLYFWLAAFTIASAAYALAGTLYAEGRLRYGFADLNTLRALTGVMRRAALEAHFEKIGPDAYRADATQIEALRAPLTRVFFDNWLNGASGTLAVLGLAQIVAAKTLILAGFTFQLGSLAWSLYLMRELIEDLRRGQP